MPWTLDPALLRRFQRIFKVSLPAPMQRGQILKNELKNCLVEKTVALEEIVEKTEDHSGSDLAKLCVLAKRSYFKRLTNSKQKSFGLNNDDFETALKAIKVCTDSKWNARYKSWFQEE